MDTLSGFSSRRAPFNVYRVSSFEIAKIVLSITVARIFAGRVARGFGTGGKTGKLSFAMPTSLNDERSQVTCTH